MLRHKRKAVISLHGINTDGAWQKNIASTISQLGWVYYPLHYGNFHPLRFCMAHQRNAKVEWFRKEFKIIQDQISPIKPSVIAHSFGTYIVTKALEKYDFIRLDKLILCGSIAPVEYDWQKLFDNKQITKTRNDSGGEDCWAGIVNKFARGTGPSGKNGFSQKHDRLVDINHGKLKHSDYLASDFCEAHWVPILEESVPYIGETIPPSVEEEGIGPIEAARWSALTYYKQFILRALTGLPQNVFPAKGSDIPKKCLNENGSIKADGVTIVMPDTPNDAKESAIESFSATLGLQNVTIGASPRTIKYATTDGWLYDIPTIVNSLLLLDHRQNDELRPAVFEFHQSLGKHINSLGLLERPKVRILKLSDLVK